jgi:hypothetical protein
MSMCASGVYSKKRRKHVKCFVRVRTSGCACEESSGLWMQCLCAYRRTCTNAHQHTHTHTHNRRSLDKLHTQLLASRGKLLVELVESLGGKPVPGKVGKLSPNKKDAAGQLYGMFDSTLGESFL